MAAVMLQFTIFVTALLGLVGLALDGSRFLLLNNDLQDMADAAALAGAAELDGTSDALTRADAAARTLLQNNPRWWDVAGVKIESVTFYSQLNPDVVTNDPAQASYIKVVTGSWQVAPTFLVAVGALSNNATTTSAVAGTSFVSCAPIQSFICGANFPATTPSGAFFTLLANNDGNWASGSGNWGVLADPDCQTPDCYTSVFARLPRACTTTKRHQQTGNAVAMNAAKGINVRFDRPQGSGDLSTSAPVVIDGYISNGKACSNWSSANPKQFDPVTNYSACKSGSCPLPRNLANLGIYWQNQHGTALPAGMTTRYGAYRCELGFDGCAPPKWSQTAEPAAPSCSAKTLTGLDGLARRVISVGIIDTCPSGNSGDEFIITKYADFFLTEAADASGNTAVYAEYIQTYTANSPGSKLYKIVRLQR